MMWYYVVLSLAATQAIFWNIQNQSAGGNVIQLNKKISLTTIKPAFCVFPYLQKLIA